MLFFLISSFLILLFLGVPIAAAMGIPSAIYFTMKGIPISSMTYSMFQSLNSFTMISVPMFILMGTLVNAFRETDRVFNFARILLKNTRGYSAKVNVIVSLIFAGISGAALADIGGLGQMEIKAMEDEGYSRAYASALTIATATVGPIFPPSVPLVIYAMVAQVSSVKALIAGAIPGLLITFTIYLYVVLTNSSKLENTTGTDYIPSQKSESLLKSFLESLPILLAAPAIVFSMLFGIFSPGEAGALGVLYLLLIGFLHKEVTLERLYNSLKETFYSVSSIILVVATGAIFTKALTLEKLPLLVTTKLLGFSENSIVILLVMNAILLVLGLFMESISALILVTPIFLTIASQIGIDPVHMGVIIVFNLMLGMTTPPFGMSIYAVSNVGKVSPEAVIKEMLPLYIPLLISLIVVTFVPSLSLWLPNMIFK